MPKPIHAGARLRALQTAGLYALAATISLTAVPAQNLVGEWRLNEGGGIRIPDTSGNGNNGVFAAPPHAPVWSDGRIGGGLRFDRDAAVVVPPSPTLEPANVTVEAWVRHVGYPGIASVSHIVAKGGAGGSAQASYALYSYGGLNFYIGTSAGHIFSPDPGPRVWDGAWHYIVGTYDGSAVRLYVDGVEVGSGTPMTLPIVYRQVPPYDLTIGNYGDTSAFTYSYPYVGDIDEVKVWNRALSACEINAAYQAARSYTKPSFNLLTTLRDSGGFTTFLGLLQESGLASAIAQSSAMTVFAPNDKAFAALPKGALETLRKDPAQLRAFVGRHIVNGRVAMGRIGDVAIPSPIIANYKGEPAERLYVECHPGGCNVGDDQSGSVVRADTEAGNGLIQEIDHAMIRPIVIPPL